MADWNLLWLMILKEFRTTIRERSQSRALAVSLVIVLLVAGNFIYHSAHSGRRAHGLRELVQPSIMTEQQQHSLRWAAIAGCAAVGFFFSTGYLLSAVLACFVGEKEGKTLEILLASPLGDEKLYAFKAVSVLIPSAAIGACFAVALMAVARIFIPNDVLHLPLALVFAGPALGIVLMMLLQCWFVGLGAAISAKAETMKGATQTLGAVFSILIFGVGYGVPLGLANFPSLRTPLINEWFRWMGLPFGQQYGMALVAVGLPALFFLRVGRLAFRRDRLLT